MQVPRHSELDTFVTFLHAGWCTSLSRSNACATVCNNVVWKQVGQHSNSKAEPLATKLCFAERKHVRAVQVSWQLVKRFWHHHAQWREGLVESDLCKFRTTRLGCQRLVLCDALPVRRRVDATRPHGLAKCAQRQTKPIALVHRATRRTPRTRVVWSQALSQRPSNIC